MSIVPASLLSPADLARLGNNLGPPAKRTRRPATAGPGRALAAVNRSLAPHGERVDRLEPARACAARP